MAARIITGIRCNTSKSNLYKELGWDTLSSRRENHKLTLMFKILNNLTPDYMNNMLEGCMPIQHNYNLRNPNSYRIPILRTVSYYNSFVPSTISLWKNLSDDCKNSPTLQTFKNKLNPTTPIQKNKYKLYNYGNRIENIIHSGLPVKE